MNVCSHTGVSVPECSCRACLQAQIERHMPSVLGAAERRDWRAESRQPSTPPRPIALATPGDPQSPPPPPASAARLRSNLAASVPRLPQQGSGARRHQADDSVDLGGARPCAEGHQADEGGDGRLETHQDAEDAHPKAAERLELERVGNRRAEQGDGRADRDPASSSRAAPPSAIPGPTSSAAETTIASARPLPPENARPIRALRRM